MRYLVQKLGFGATATLIYFSLPAAALTTESAKQTSVVYLVTQAEAQEDYDYWFRQCYELIGQEGLAACDRALEFNDRDAIVWYNRGIILGKDLGQPEAALASFERSIELDPESAKAWNNLGVALSTLNRDEEAMRAYEEALRIDPNDELARRNLATLRERLEI